ncbi:hypothetical protein K469DRAFT_685560 [Zopfia rhizophila CBS 207.26]|uniref:Uncharacterized protein n=1 Tax=Zopfia rhizophila CBS 207.26 TaxID=1314779 RepID=A0A6A6E6W4_9PEZI|nr:hypothetical protein K469DRAFT_685560 [Zopfia rhizophila CBS 207.26]
MAPLKPNLLDLPLGIFRAILTQAVQLRGLKRALRLRLVNKGLVGALSTSKIMDDCDILLSKMPIARSYLEQRVLEERTTAYPRLNIIRRAAERLGDRRERIVRRRSSGGSTGELSIQAMVLPESPALGYKGSGSHEEGTFEYDLLTAAAFTNKLSLVRNLVKSHLGLRIGTFGNPYGAAVREEHLEVLIFSFRIQTDPALRPDTGSCVSPQGRGNSDRTRCKDGGSTGDDRQEKIVRRGSTGGSSGELSIQAMELPERPALGYRNLRRWTLSPSQIGVRSSTMTWTTASLKR